MPQPKTNTTVIDFQTSSGSVDKYFGYPFPFLNEEQRNQLDEIGYTGKLNGAKTSRTEFLNSLDLGDFTIKQTKYDNGDFSEKFTLVRVVVLT